MMHLNMQMMMHLKEAFEMSSLEMKETQSNIFAKFNCNKKLHD